MIVTLERVYQNEEVRCVLEHFSQVLNRWEPHMYFELPVAEAREIRLDSPPPGE